MESSPPPQETCICPYDCLCIAAANLLPREWTRLVPCPPSDASTTPSGMGVNREAASHPPPFSEDPRNQGARKNTELTYGSPDPETRAARPPPSAQRGPTSRSSPLFLQLSKRDLLSRISTVKRTHSVRIRSNKRQHQSMLTVHWPELRSASLPL